MLLPPQDVGLFFKLHKALMFFVNQRLQVLPDPLASPEAFASVSPEKRLKVREAFLKHTDLLQTFVEENPAHLTEEELAIVSSWRHQVAGKFYVFRQLKKYMVFLSAEGPPVAYGVLALSQPLEELVGPYLPVLVDTVLLPFKGVIVYDGLLNSYRIHFGAGVRRSLNESYQEAKARHGIVASLPMSDQPPPTKPPRARRVPPAPTKEEKDEVLRAITDMTDRFCREHLNEEYAVLCRRLAEKLARKRPSPLLHGSLNAWASGIVRTIGWVNFLSDKTQTPHMRLGDIDAHFGVGQSTGAAKLAAIRKLLKIHPLDPNWTMPPAWRTTRWCGCWRSTACSWTCAAPPGEVQEIAFAKGLIPYIPADRTHGGE